MMLEDNKKELDHVLIIDEFIDHLWLEDGLSQNTLNSYRFDLKIFYSWLLKNKVDLLNVSQADIEQYLAYKFPSSKSRSISRLLATLRRFYRFLLRDNKVKTDPTLNIQTPKVPKSLPKSLSEEEVEALIAAPDIDHPVGVRDRAMLEILYACGLRVTELVGLLVTEIILQDGVIRVTGKGQKTRLVPMGEESVDWVKKYLHESRPKILVDRTSKF